MIWMIPMLLSVFGQGSVEPPPMPKRSIEKPSTPPPGRHIDLYGDGKYTLYIPEGWVPTAKLGITVHFHGAAWFAIDEHRRRGLAEPLVAIYAGEGSSVYRAAFEDADDWPRLLSDVLAELGAPEDAIFERVDVTSFSAGYGAVRELLKQPDPPKLVRRIILADSMYSSFTSDRDHTPLKEQIDPYVEFARAATRGEKAFVVTYSEVPTETYANSAACAEALVKAVGGKLATVRAGSLPATRDPLFPLKFRFDQGAFHVWGYGGKDAQAHMTHPRHIADIWKAVFRS
jgi:hypothetical protein